MALKRLQNEFKNLRKKPIPLSSVSPKDNFLEWTANITEKKCCIFWDLYTCKSKTISLMVHNIRKLFVKSDHESDFLCFTVKDIKKDKELVFKNNIKIIQKSKLCELYTILTRKITQFIEKSTEEKFKPKIILITGSLSFTGIIEQIKDFSELLLIYGENAPKDMTRLMNAMSFKRLEKIALSNDDLNTSSSSNKSKSKGSVTFGSLNCMKSDRTHLNNMPYENMRNRQIQESNFYYDNSVKNSIVGQNSKTYAQNSGKYNKRSTDLNVNQNDYYSRSETIAGVCGLRNLGNTCFMNSALQCLSNIPIFTDFILNNYNQMSSHLNYSGKKRKTQMLFDYYCDIIQLLWVKKTPTISVKEFRQEVSKIGPTFRAYEQNDCCEFITFVLNTFHEELNQYNDCKDVHIDWQSVNTSENFSNYLSNYKMVNNSFVSENFHGFQKFSLNCICGKSFTTNFSPFSCIYLPHPNTNEEPVIKSKIKDKNCKKVNINLIPLLENTCNINIIKFSITIPKDGFVHNIRKKTAETYNKLCGKNLNYVHLVITNIIDSHIIKVYENYEYDSVTEDLTVYEMSPLSKRQLFITLVSERFGSPFGLPILINTDDSCYESINKNFGKVFVKFLDFGGEDPDIIEMKIEMNIRFKILWPNSSSAIDYNPNDKYYLKQNCVIMAIIPADFQDIYRTERINQINVHSKESELFDSVSNKSFSLYDCLDQYLATEELSESDRLLCDNCLLSQVPTKTLEIVYAPNILLLQLKRSKSNSRRNTYEYNYYYYSRKSNCIDFPIELSLENYVITPQINGESLMYDLIAVSNHSGSNFGGHYTTYAKNVNNKWYSFNDSIVYEISDKQLVTQNAYLLVYLKRVIKLNK